MPSGLAINVQSIAGIGDASRITLNGPLDARTVVELQTAVQGLQGQGVKRFVVDLTEVKYVNSTGLSYLINLSESLGEGRPAVTLVGMQPKVKIVFDTMGVGDFFSTAPSVDAAVKALRKEPAPRPSPAPAVKREQPSGKTGRMSPPTSHEPPSRTSVIVRFFRKLFGGR